MHPKIIDHASTLSKKQKAHIVIGGDWNTIQDALDSSHPHTMDNVDILTTLNEKLDLFDFAGKTKDHEDLFTRAHNVGDETHFTRLDKILTTHALVKHIQDIKVRPTLHS